MDLLQHILAFIFALGLLVTFHEFGHYWVARLCDVKILRFSVGFGKPLLKRHYGPDQTEFVIAAIPLGGYVKMLDEREGEVDAAELPRAFNRKSLGQRFAIVFAGPLFNYIFAVFAFWLVFMIGVTGYKPVIGEVNEDSIAARAGLEPGQQITAVNGHKTKIWASVMDRSVNEIIKSKDLVFEVQDQNASQTTVRLSTDGIGVDQVAGGKLMKVLGIAPDRVRIPAVVGEVMVGRPAERAGFAAGDVILAVDGRPVKYWSEWAEYLTANPGKAVTVELERDSQRLQVNVQAEVHAEDDDGVPRVGVTAYVPEDLTDDPARKATESYGPGQSISMAFVKVWDVTALSLRVIGKMLTGQASVKISVVRYP